MEKLIGHRTAVVLFCQMVEQKGLTVKIMPETHCPFDLLLSNGLRIEIKSCKKRYISSRRHEGKQYKYYGWQFNIHHHNVLPPENSSDYYAIFLADRDIWLIMPSKMLEKHKVKQLTEWGLRTSLAPYVNAFECVYSSL